MRQPILTLHGARSWYQMLATAGCFCALSRLRCPAALPLAAEIQQVSFRMPQQGMIMHS